MGLRDIEATLPPGFRFYPSDEELVCHYLLKKILKEEIIRGTLVEIDLHTCEPWQLPEVAKLNSSEWYFFSFRDRKYSTGFRTNRATICGYWKATGKDRIVINPSSGEIAGMRKTLVFYRNRAPHGIKTGWIMHEFRLDAPHLPPKEDWVLCRVFHKSKGGEEEEEELASKWINEHGQECSEAISGMSASTVGASEQSLSYSPLIQTTQLYRNEFSYCFTDVEKERSGFAEDVGVQGRNDGGCCEEFGYLWDLSFEQSNGEVVPNGVEITRLIDKGQ